MLMQGNVETQDVYIMVKIWRLSPEKKGKDVQLEDNRSNNTGKINLNAWTFTVENRCFCALSNGDWLYRAKKLPIKDAEYSSFMKPSVGSSIEAVDRASKPDGIHLKVRQFFKKLSRKTYRGCLDNKSTCSSLSGHEEKKNSEKLQAKKDSNLSINLMKPASAKHYKSSTEDSSPPLSSNQSLRKPSHFSVDSDEKNGIDEGIICCNLLISRLFFA
ncbi:hypothetical protein K1719_007121 [Acacia pycnantha]|nr:hypothetical protein K1719_007121 [Acacia pycnantha]